MAFYSLVDGLDRHDPQPVAARGPTRDLVSKFLEHFALVRSAPQRPRTLERGGRFFYDQLAMPDGTKQHDQGPLDGRRDPACSRRSVLRRGLIDRAGRSGRSSPSCAGQGRRGRGARRGRGSLRGAPATRASCSAIVEIARVTRLVRTAARRGRVPLATRAPLAVRLSTASTPTRSTLGGDVAIDQLRAGGVHDAHVRWQLELAGPGVVPAELPRLRRARAARTVLRGRRSGSSSRPARATMRHVHRDRRTTCDGA